MVAAALSCSLAPLRRPAAGTPAQSAATVRPPAAKPAKATPAPDTFTFRAIGPAASGGRVSAVAGSDRDDRLYYVGGAGGGVFKSTDGGTSFQPAWTGPQFGAIGAIAVAPSNANVVWAGTGEANPRNDVSYGDGVWRSRDGGKHWTHAGLDDTALISKILVDPREPEPRARRARSATRGRTATRAASTGTDDGGRTWTKTLFVGPASGAADLAWNPKRPQTVFAAIWQFRRQPWIATSGGPQDGLYRSRDGGRSWTKIAGTRFSERTARPHRRRGRAERSAPRLRGRAVEAGHGMAFRRRRRQLAQDLRQHAARAAPVLLQPPRGRSARREPRDLALDVPDRLEERREDVEASRGLPAPRQPRDLVVGRRPAHHRRQRRRRRAQPQRRRIVGRSWTASRSAQIYHVGFDDRSRTRSAAASRTTARGARRRPRATAPA